MTVENIPDPNDFTKEIEGTIDDLFNPTKKIVIDPLTNEVKEVEEKEALLELEEVKQGSDNANYDKSNEDNNKLEQIEVSDKEQTDSLLLISEEKEPKDIIEEELLSDDKNILEIEPEDTNLSNNIEQKEEIDEELEFELELENEDISENTLTEDDVYVDEITELTDKLEQVVLTVEWEITPKLVEDALKIVKQLKDKLSDNQVDQTKSIELLTLMEEIIEYLLVSPDKLPTNTPIVLKKGVKTLKALLKNQPLSEHETKNVISDFKDILESYKNSTKKINKKDISEEKANAKSSIKNNKTTIKQDIVDPRIKDLLLETIKKQLIILDECIDKIIPIEQTLYKSKEAQKLYLFHKTLREELENQYNYIINNLQKFNLLPKELTKKKKRNYTSKPIENLIEDKKSICPWTRLLGINWNNRFSAIPPNLEIVYNGPIPRKAKNQIKNSNTLELSKFKTWPWTKIKNMFLGKLSQKTEEELKTITVPIIDNPSASQLFGAERSGNHLIIIDTPKGLCAIVTSGPPQEIPGPFDKNWEPEKGKDNPIAGYVKQGEQKIPVIEIEKLLK